MTEGPMAYRWSGEAMEPVGRFMREANERFIVGAVYALDEIEERSTASHRHYFSTVNDIWRTLPEHLTDRFPSAKALRSHALIQTGHFNETRLDAGSNPAALRVAAVMQADEPLAAIVVRGPLVVRRIARSQKYRAMDKGEFQASKSDVLDFLAELIGVDPAQFQSTGGDSAAPNKRTEAAA